MVKFSMQTEDEVVGERKTAKEVEAGKVKTKPRKMSEKEALLQKLDEMYQFLTKALSNIYALFEDNKCFNEEIMNRHFVRVDNVDDAPSLISVDIKGSDDQSQRVSNKSSMGCKQLERYKKGTVVQGQSNVYHGKDTYTTLDKNLLRDNIHFNRRNPLKVHFDCQQKEITSKSDIEKNLCLNSTNDKQHDASRSRTELPKAGPIESLERNERSYTLPRYLRINPESFSQQCKRRRSTLGFIDIANQLKASLKASDDDISNDSATADSALESKHLSEEPVKSMELLSSRTRSVLNYLRDRVHSEDSIGKDSGLDFKKEVDRNFVTKTQICQLGSKGSMSKIPHEFFGKKKSADFAPFLGVQFNIEGCKEVSDINNIRGLSTSFNWSDDRIKSGNDLASMYSQITAERLRSMAINNAIALYNGSAFVTQHRANPIAMVNDLNTMHCCIPSLFLSCRNALMPRFLASHEVKPPWHRPWNSSYSATLARIDTTTTIETPDMTKIPATTWKIDPNKIYMNQLLTATLDVTLFIVRQVRGILLVRPLNTTFSLDEHGMESASNILSGIMEKSVHRIETGSLIPSEKKEMMKNDDYQASCFAGSILTDAPAQGNSAVILAVLPLRFICMKLFFFPVRHIENNIEHHELTITLTQLGLLYRNLASKNVKSGMHKAKARDTTIKPLKNLCGQLFVVNTVAFLDKDDENKSDSSDRNTSISFDDDVKAPNQLVATADVLGKTEFEGVPLSRISMTITLRDLMDNTGIRYVDRTYHTGWDLPCWSWLTSKKQSLNFMMQ